MDAALKLESEKLRHSWTRHEAAHLRDYLVAEVEDPRINLQSVLSRHVLLRDLFGERFAALQDAEIGFSAALNWLCQLRPHLTAAEDWRGVLHGLRRGADNVEGIALPAWVGHLYAGLPATIHGVSVPNYLEASLTAASLGAPATAGSDTFETLWRELLGTLPRREPAPRVLEAACGSANDYRCLAASGLARLIDYTGFDLCDKNVANARALFPGARFEPGNVFEIAAPDGAFDCLLAHDLFEHLSPAGLEAAVGEVCRVTRRTLSLGFFSMAELPDHRVRPTEQYHWNTLSVERVRARFVARGFRVRILHLGTFLRHAVGGDPTPNPDAYALVVTRGELAGACPTREC